MPPVTAIHIAIATVAIIAGLALGWLTRGRRCAREKFTVNAGWQEQLEAQRMEHGRLVDQNKGLMQQVSQFRASNSDATRRTGELASALKEAQARRDELQSEIKHVRGKLESLAEKRRELEHDLRLLSATDSSLHSALAEKDEKIFKLSRELESWHSRLPPLISRFRERNADAERLETELAEAREKVHALESVLNSDQTRVEPVNPQTLSNGLNASNDTLNASGALALVPADRLRDDLKCIKGIGPAIEKTLNELGIFRFSQIAELSEYDIDRVASRLRGFRTRIYREDWVGQARELQRPPSNSD